MHAVVVIAAKDLRQRLRDRSAIILGFVAPVVVATLMSLAMRGTEDFHLDLGVVDEDGGPVAAGFLEALDAPELADVVTVEVIDTAAVAAAAVDDGEVAAALVLRSGLTAAITTGSPASIDVLASVDDALSGQVARSLAASFVAQLNAARLSVSTALAAGIPPDQEAALVAAAAQLRLPVGVEQRPSGSLPLEGINYYGPGMAVFFVLFAIGFTARSFFGERREGTLDRMAASPISPRTILAGKALSVFVYGLASMTTMYLVTTLVFGAHWGHPVAALAVAVAMVLAVVSCTAFVITVAREEQAADSLAQAIVFTLALLGGSFVAVFEAPALFRTLSLLTPNGWALRAYTDMSTSIGGLGDDLALSAQPIGAILVFSALVGLVAAALARRMAVR